MIHYLDNAATTPLDPAVADALARCQRSVFGNPSSLHPPGARAASLLGEARERLAGMLEASALVFTGGGTEATNLAMRGWLSGKREGRILAGSADHPSVLETARALAARGFTLDLYPVDGRCRPDLDAFTELCGEDLCFVSLLHGNNEVGSLLRLERMAAIVRERAPRAHLHVDAVQSFAKVGVDLDRSGADSMTITAHKIHGPKGIGALALGPKRRPKPLITGGGQELGLRSGTENVCAAQAFALAAEHWIGHQAEIGARLEAMRNRLATSLAERIEGLEVLGDPDDRLPNILCVALRGVVGEVVTHHLEERGICVSTGSACSNVGRSGRGGKDGGARASHVLVAMGVDAEAARGSLRISLGRLTTDADIDAIADALPEVWSELRELGV